MQARDAKGSWRTTEQGRQGVHEEHGLAAVRTKDRRGLQSRRARGIGRLVSRRGGELCRWSQALSKSGQTSAQGRGEEPIVTDFHEVFGQDML